MRYEDSTKKSISEIGFVKFVLFGTLFPFAASLIHCAPQNIDFQFEESIDIGEESTVYDTQSTTDSGDSSTEEEPDSTETTEPSEEEEEDELEIIDDPFCPEYMVSVRDELNEPIFCIDIFEITISEETLGNMDQGSLWPDGSTEAMALSLPNVFPDLFFSWYQAISLCQNAGKYMCSSEEWIDGCDGVYGSGGWKYPYGNIWTEGVCAARLGEEEQVYNQVQLTGSLPDCKSDWGTYDQIGNAWEWTDPMILDNDGLPITHKKGASYYSGGGNLQCGNNPVANHPPEFGGVITTRCCTSPTYPSTTAR
jgi:hypothetical protein